MEIITGSSISHPVVFLFNMGQFGVEISHDMQEPSDDSGMDIFFGCYLWL